MQPCYTYSKARLHLTKSNISTCSLTTVDYNVVTLLFSATVVVSTLLVFTENDFE